MKQVLVEVNFATLKSAILWLHLLSEFYNPTDKNIKHSAVFHTVS